MALLRCKDLGMQCTFVATGATVQEIMRKFIEHADPEHDMPVLSAEIIHRIQKTIQK
jgi:predicted small metal-binding protein